MIWAYFGVLLIVLLAAAPWITRWLPDSTEQLIRQREQWLAQFIEDHTLQQPPSRPQPLGDEHGNP